MSTNVEELQELLQQQQNENSLMAEDNVFTTVETASEGSCPSGSDGRVKTGDVQRLPTLSSRFTTLQYQQQSGRQTMLSHYHKTLTQFTSAVVLALLGATACSDTTKDQTQAEPPQNEPQQIAQPAEFKCELPGWAVEHKADGSDRVTVFDLTLGEPLPAYESCGAVIVPSPTKAPCIEEIESWAHSTAGPYLKYGTAGEAVIWYPSSMGSKGYPNATVVGLNKEGAAIYFSFTSYSLEKRPAEILGQVTSKDQQCYLQMVNKLLGEPQVYVTRKRDPNMTFDESIYDRAPAGVPSVMWDIANDGSVIAQWQTKAFWARYTGQHYQSHYGRLEIGAQTMFGEGKRPAEL